MPQHDDKDIIKQAITIFENRLVKADLNWKYEQVEGGWWYKFFICPNCGWKACIANVFPNVHNKSYLYALGYRTVIRCHDGDCCELYTSKTNPEYFKFDAEVKEENWNLDSVEFVKVIETEFNLPWYFEKDDCHGDDFVYDCVGDIILGNEQYYPTCSMNESMMKKLVDLVNNKGEGIIV